MIQQRIAGRHGCLAGDLQRALGLAGLCLRRRLAHQFKDGHIELARGLAVPGLVAHDDFEQLVHRLGETLAGQMRLSQCIAGVEVALVGRDRRLQRRAVQTRGSFHRGQPMTQRGEARMRGDGVRCLRRHRRERRLGILQQAQLQQRFHIVEARGLVGRIGLHGLGQLGQCRFKIAVGHQRLGFGQLFLGLQHFAGGHMLVQELADLRLGDRADKAVHRLAADEHHAEGNRAHAEGLAQLAGNLGLLVAVELGEQEAPGISHFQLLEHRTQALAGTAPGRPDVQQHRLLHRGLQEFGFEVLDGDVDHGVGVADGAEEGRWRWPPTIQGFPAYGASRAGSAERHSPGWRGDGFQQ